MKIKLAHFEPSEQNIKTMGERIREKRIEKGLSIGGLSQLTGIPKSTIQQYESGKVRKIGLEKRNTLTKVLELNKNELDPEFYAAQTFFANWEKDRQFMLDTISTQFGDAAVKLLLTYGELSDEYRDRLEERANELLTLYRSGYTY